MWLDPRQEPTAGVPSLPALAGPCLAHTDDVPSGALRDRFGRVLDYLRLAVNETCNLRCRYCMPAEGLPFRLGDELLRDEETVRLCRLAARLGTRKVRLTGGEPLLRRGLHEVIREVAATPGIKAVHLTTNGLLLAKQAATLAAAGLAGVNISLDTLKPQRFREITRRGGFDAVQAGLAAALAHVPSVKLNVVALRGVNDDEFADFVELTRDASLGVRFIELMPFDAHQIWRTGRFLTAERICKRLQDLVPTLERTQGSSTEHHAFRVPGYQGTVAVIPAYTRSLCRSCNRLRITADGRVLNCLYAGDGPDLRNAMREGADDAELERLIRGAVEHKAATGWHAQRAAKAEQQQSGRESMGQIGG